MKSGNGMSREEERNKAEKERKEAMFAEIKEGLYKAVKYLYDGVTGQDEVLVGSAKPYMRMRFFFCFGFAYSAAQSLLAKQGAHFLEQALETSSEDAKLRFLLCIGAIQLIGFAADKIKTQHNRDFMNTLDKSSLKTTKGEVGLISDELGINYLKSIYASIKTFNQASEMYGGGTAQGIISLYSLATVLYDSDSNLFESMVIMQIASVVSLYINAYIDASRQSSEASLAIIQNRVYELQNTVANHQYTSFQMDIFEKQLNALLLQKQSLEHSLARYESFSYMSKFATSMFYAYSTITAIESAAKGSKHYTSLIFDIQSFLSSLVASSNRQELATFNDATAYYNIITTHGALWFLEEEKRERRKQKAKLKAQKEGKDWFEVYEEMNKAADDSNIKEGSIVAEFYKTTKMVDEDGHVQTKKAKVVFEYDLATAEQSIVLKGENGLGKSCLLRAIGGANMRQLDDTSTKPHTYTTIGLTNRDVAYIPQGELTSLTNLTIFKDITQSNGITTLLKTYWIGAKKAMGVKGMEVLPKVMTKNPDNLGGITPFDIFTVLLTKEQKEANKAQIHNECVRLIKKLAIELPFETTTNLDGTGTIDLDKCIEFGNPSGGEQQKIKFIMMAVAARYGEKKLILVDELYNHIDIATCVKITKEFKKLLKHAPTVRFISTDHRPIKKYLDEAINKAIEDVIARAKKGNSQDAEDQIGQAINEIIELAVEAISEVKADNQGIANAIKSALSKAKDSGPQTKGSVQPKVSETIDEAIEKAISGAIDKVAAHNPKNKPLYTYTYVLKAEEGEEPSLFGR